MTPEEREALRNELKVIFKHNDISKPLTQKLFELACMYPGKIYEYSSQKFSRSS